MLTVIKSWLGLAQISCRSSRAVIFCDPYHTLSDQACTNFTAMKCYSQTRGFDFGARRFIVAFIAFDSWKIHRPASPTSFVTKAMKAVMNSRTPKVRVLKSPQTFQPRRSHDRDVFRNSTPVAASFREWRSGAVVVELVACSGRVGRDKNGGNLEDQSLHRSLGGMVCKRRDIAGLTAAMAAQIPAYHS